MDKSCALIKGDITSSIKGFVRFEDNQKHNLHILIDNFSYVFADVNLQTTDSNDYFTFKFYIPSEFDDGLSHKVQIRNEEDELLDTKLMVFNNLEENPAVIELKNSYVEDYKNNVNRSFKQRLTSTFYPFSILSNYSKFGGLKNVFSTIKGYKALKNSNLFDLGYYLYSNPSLRNDGMDAILHYLYHGNSEGKQPSTKFNGERYLELNGDLNKSKLNPLIHYVLYGKKENRPIHYNSKLNNQPDYIKNEYKVVKNSNLFNEKYYLTKYVDVQEVNIDPLEHYLITGAKEGRNPSAEFNTEYYQKTYKNDINMAINPLVHYIQEGKDVQVQPDIKGYLNPQHKANVVEGWLAKIGDNSPQEAQLEIDGTLYNIKADIYDASLDYAGINEGNHAFKFNISTRFSDNKKHFVKLFDGEGNLIDSMVSILNKGSSIAVEKTRILTKSELESLNKNILENANSFDVPTFGEDAPLVSFVVVNRNGINYLSLLLDSLGAVKENYPNFELIIVDNASTDGSIDLINSYNDLPIKLIENNKNETFSHANNQTVEISNGQYLLFLNNDIEPLPAFLNFMMESALSRDDVGVVGARLFYPDCSSSQINKDKSYSIQHAGIVFKESEGFIKPFNRHNSKEYYESEMGEVRHIACVTAAVMLVSKKVFDEVGGFDEGYVYGYEDVDFCLKVHKAGYYNLYDSRATLFHYEFGTQEKNDNKAVRNRRLNNKSLFIKKWNKWLRNQYFMDKVENNCLFSDNPLTVAFVVTQADEDTTAGDYFTALTLANRLEEFGWNIKYLAQKGSSDWYDVGDDVDVLISLLDKYDLSKIITNNGMLIKIAWLRNWFDRWVEPSEFKLYDIILASSNKACEYVKEVTGKDAVLFPLATEPSMFNEDVESDESYLCDYCFTGSYWNADRQIVNCLSPDDLDYSFNLYGVNWEKVGGLDEYIRGFVDYSMMPVVYSSSLIVLDDANHVTVGWGSVNSRVFDAIASGDLVITNGSLGNDELFNGEIPEYHTKDDLCALIAFYMENEDLREDKIKILQEIVLKNHTYQNRANKLRELLIDYNKSHKIAIKIPSPSWDEVQMWGDFHVAEGLEREFVNKGYYVKLQILPDWDNGSDVDMDTVIVLRGLSKYEPKQQQFNIMWNISHPDEISTDEYNSYDYVFIASEKWASHIQKQVVVPVECMWQCTDTNRFYPDYDEEYASDLLFVGNSRNVYRKIINDLLPTDYDLAVYGSNWNEFIDKKYIKAEHISNKKLHCAYSSCKILLNDHWDDMREKGFVSNRIFDGIACGTTIISDDVDGLNKLFPSRVYTYTSSDELKSLVDKIIKNKVNYDASLIEGHSYADRVNQFIDIIKNKEKEMVISNKN